MSSGSEGTTVAPLPRLAARGAAEAAAVLGVSEDFWVEHVAHEIGCVRRGRLKLYPLAELDAWLEANSERVLDGAPR